MFYVLAAISILMSNILLFAFSPRANAGAHRSFSDALATGLLFKKLVDEKVPQ